MDLSAWELSENTYAVANNLSDGRRSASKLRGVESAEQYLVTNPAKAAHILLAAESLTIEKSTGRQSWCYPDNEVAHYLNQIAAWGYALSPVEKIAEKIADEPAEAQA